MNENTITNAAQARTAEEYADYLAKEITNPQNDAAEKDRLLHRMMELANDLADYRMGVESTVPPIKLVIDNRFPKLNDRTAFRRDNIKLVSNSC